MTNITVKLATFFVLLGSLLSTYQCNVKENNPNEVRDLLKKIDNYLDSQSCSIPLPQPEKVSRSCFDITSSQSVLQQLCEKITALELKVDNRAVKNPSRNLQQDESKPNNISVEELSKLKQEIALIKRWSVFTGVKFEKIASSYTRQTIEKYTTTLNDGTAAGFDCTNGVYTAHYDGIYRFSLKYPKPPPEVKLLETSIVKEKDDKMNLLAKSSDDQSTQLEVMVALTVGDKVWTNFTIDITPETIYEATFTFSGFLVN